MLYALAIDGDAPLVVYGLTHTELKDLRNGRHLRFRFDGPERAAPGPVEMVTVAAADRAALEARVQEIQVAVRESGNL